MYIVLTNCGLFDTGDELSLASWLSGDESAARAEYLERLERCRRHVLGQAAIIDSEALLMWTDWYRYWNVLLEVPDDWLQPGDGADDILGRRIDEVDGSCIRMAEYGICNEHGLKQQPWADACQEILDLRSMGYGT